MSGFAGLAYELLWVRLLALGFGATTASFSVVLAVFFGGLALGSRWAGSRSVASRRPLAMYALLEAGTGVLGILLYPALKHVGALIALVDPGPGAGGVAVRLAIVGVILLPPTLLMGATLPFVSVGTITRDESTGPGIAVIYALNTLGACLGAFTITFVLLPSLGVFRSTLVTAGLNFLVAGVAFVLSRRGDGPAASPLPEAPAGALPTPPAPPSPAVPPKVGFAVTLAALVGGLVATGAQVVWGRLFAIQLRGTSYGIGSVLVAVLLGIALGSLVAAVVIRRSSRIALTAALFLGLTLLGLYLFVVTVPTMTWALAAVPSFASPPFLQNMTELALIVAFLALPCGASGAVLPTLVAVTERSAGRSGQALARLYAANTLGCIIGSILTGFVLLPTLGSPTTMYLLYLTLVLVLVLFLVATSLQNRLEAVGLIVLGLAGAAWFPQLDLRFASQVRVTMADLGSFLRSVREGRDTIIATYEGDVATASVTRFGQGRALQLNGLGQGSYSPVPPNVPFESVLVATVPWVHAPAHDRALIVGLGAGGTVATLANLGVGRIDVAELEEGVVTAVGDIWGAASPLNDPRVHVIRNDARHHLLVTSRRAPQTYDFITSMPAHPWIAAALFTQEFFELARANLKPAGVFTTWFGVDNMSDETLRGLVGAFAAVFPEWIIYFVGETSSLFLVGSTAPLSFDVARANTLVTHPALPGFGRHLLDPAFLASRVASASTPGTQPSPVINSTDDNGLVEFSTQRKRVASIQDALGNLPAVAMPARLVKGVPVEPFLLKTFEQRIGSPSGWLPLPSTDAAAVRRSATSFDETLPAPLRAYARFRVELAEGRRDRAKETLTGLEGDAELKRRAAKLLAATEPLDKRAAALEALPLDADVRATLVALGDAPTEPPLPLPTIDDDPLGWLFADPTLLSSATPETRGRVLPELLARLAKFSSQRLYEHCDRHLTAGGWAAASVCRELAIDVRRREASVLTRQALELGAREKYQDALQLLLKANALAPLAEAQARALLQTAAKLGDARGLEIARDLLLARGIAPETIAGLERRASEAEPPPPPPPAEEP